MMAPEYEQAAQVLEPQVRLAKVNNEEQEALHSTTACQYPDLDVVQTGS